MNKPKYNPKAKLGLWDYTADEKALANVNPWGVDMGADPFPEPTTVTAMAVVHVEIQRLNIGKYPSVNITGFVNNIRMWFFNISHKDNPDYTPALPFEMVWNSMALNWTGGRTIAKRMSVEEVQAFMAEFFPKNTEWFDRILRDQGWI